MRYSSFTTSSPALFNIPYFFWSSYSLYGSDRYFITYYQIVVGSAALITPNLPNYNRETITSLMISSTTLCTSSIFPLDVVLLENLMMFWLFKEPNTGRYVKSTTGW